MPLPGRLRKFFAFASLSLLLLVPFAPPLSGPPAKQASRVIVGAQVADGTGGPLRRAKGRITDGRITRIGVDGEVVWGGGYGDRRAPGAGAGTLRQRNEPAEARQSI